MPVRRSTRMLLARRLNEPREDWREPTRMRRDGEWYERPRSNWDDGWAYPVEDRFRDRRGREHYDNGRFAPMSDGRWYGPYSDERHPFVRDERGGEDVRPIGFNAVWEPEMRGGADATIPQYREMDHMPGNRAAMGGYVAGERKHHKMDEHTAMEWVHEMHNEDGTTSPHWTMEQIKQVSKQKGLDIELAELFAVMNMLYSDFDPVFKKHNVSNMEFYIDMAKCWIRDKDGVENKTMAYYECIVK